MKTPTALELLEELRRIGKDADSATLVFDLGNRYGFIEKSNPQAAEAIKDFLDANGFPFGIVLYGNTSEGIVFMPKLLDHLAGDARGIKALGELNEHLIRKYKEATGGEIRDVSAGEDA